MHSPLKPPTSPAALVGVGAAVTQSNPGLLSGGPLGPTQSLSAGLNVTFTKIPHRRFLYGIDLSRGEITMLASPGGTGKSSLAIGIAASLSVAKKLLDEKIWGAGLKALYINGEDSALEMRRRLWGFAAGTASAKRTFAISCSLVPTTGGLAFDRSSETKRATASSMRPPLIF